MRHFLTLGLSLCLIFACEKKSDDTNESDDSQENQNNDQTSQTGSLQVEGDITSGFSGAVPKDLAVTSVTASHNAATLKAGQIGVSTALVNGGEKGDDHYLSKVYKIKKVLAAKDIKDCAAAVPQEFNFAQGGLSSTPCSGLSIDYTNHPDTNESGDIGSGDAGLIFDNYEPNDSESGACAVGVVNTLMNNLGSYADTATGIQAMLSCAARLSDEHSLPEAGETVNVFSALESIDMSDFGIESATIEREQDANGFPVYVTKATGWLKDVPRNLKKNIEIYVKHIQTADENKSYKGVIQYQIEDFEGSDDLVISIAYEWSDKTLSYRFRQSKTASASADAFDSATLEVKSPSSLGSGWQEIISETNENGFGKVGFVWATFDALVFNVLTKSDGTGVAYFGHNPESISPTSDDYLKIKGFRCYPKDPPPPGTDATIYSNYVQRQTFDLDTDSGEWELDQSNIAFAPTVSCDWDSSSNATFTIKLENNSTQSLQYPLTNKLYSKTDYQSAWQPPSGPSGL